MVQNADLSGILERKCTSLVYVYAIYSYTIYCSTQAKNLCIWFIENRYALSALFIGLFLSINYKCYPRTLF
jgi:hypothetical protein